MVATTIKQSAWVVVTTAVLSAAAFTVLPGTAEAQDMPSGEAAQVNNETPVAPSMEYASESAAHSTVVVNPGDSLWSIAQEQLQPDATPQQIAVGVEQIYELNRDRIGWNPNLIYSGQEFLLPPLLAEPTVSEESEITESGTPELATMSEPTASKEPVASEPTASDEPAVTEEPAAAPEESETSEPAASKSVTSEQVPEPANDKDIASNAPTDKEAVPTSGGIVGSLSGLYGNTSERQLLGLGIGALTLVIAILGAWKLPMDRSVEDSTVWKMLKERVRRKGATHYHGIYPRGQEQEAPPTGAAVSEPAPSREGTVESAAETPTGIPTTPSEDARRLRARRLRALRLRTRRKSARSGYEERSPRGR